MQQQQQSPHGSRSPPPAAASFAAGDDHTTHRPSCPPRRLQFPASKFVILTPYSPSPAPTVRSLATTTHPTRALTSLPPPPPLPASSAAYLHHSRIHVRRQRHAIHHPPPLLYCCQSFCKEPTAASLTLAVAGYYPLEPCYTYRGRPAVCRGPNHRRGGQGGHPQYRQ